MENISEFQQSIGGTGYLTSRFQQTIATIGFIGYLPYAPGTFGSVLGLLLILVLNPDNFALLIIFLLSFLLGLITSHSAEKSLGKDSRHIVIDEFSGYLLSVMLIPKSTGYLLTAFILFRIFDIIKPPPIRKIERFVPGGAGIMLDDILAAIYANLCIQAWRHFMS